MAAEVWTDSEIILA